MDGSAIECSQCAPGYQADCFGSGGGRRTGFAVDCRGCAGISGLQQRSAGRPAGGRGGASRLHLGSSAAAFDADRPADEPERGFGAGGCADVQPARATGAGPDHEGVFEPRDRRGTGDRGANREGICCQPAAQDRRR